MPDIQNMPHHFPGPPNNSTGNLGRGSGGGGGGGGGNNNMNRPSIESIIDSRRINANEICFSIPKVCVGAVIGKGGQHLRELQAEFGVRVYVEKEDYNGKRLVVLAYAGSEGNEVDGHAIQTALQRCQEHIEREIEEQLEQRQAMGDQGLNHESNTD
jgi:predicted PilT family ATPase